MIRLLQYENLPRWYGLQVDPVQDNVIYLVVSRANLQGLKNLSSGLLINELKRRHSITGFKTEIPGTFGFDGILEAIEYEDRIYFKATIPVIKQILDEECDTCSGTGDDLFRPEEKCLMCHGDRKQRESYWQKAEALVATLSVLLFFLSKQEKVVALPGNNIQLLTVGLAFPEGIRGGSIHGTYSPLMVRWLTERHGHSINPMVEAMKSAYERMFGSNQFIHTYPFRASVDSADGWLNVDCPGDSCGINPHHRGISKGAGYRFVSHNVDTAAQQITLLAGLAALHDTTDASLEVSTAP